MSNKNCINCGAPIEVETVKCPYCGTSYFDFTDIDLRSPVVLRIKTDDNSVIFLKARCSSMSMTVEPETINIRDNTGRLRTLIGNTHRTIELTFEGVN